MDFIRSLAARKPNDGVQAPHTNQGGNAGSADPGLPNLVHLPREVLQRVLHEFRIEQPLNYIRTVRNFSLVSRHCRDVVADNIALHDDYQIIERIAREEKMNAIEDAVIASMNFKLKADLLEGVKAPKKPPKGLKEIFKLNKVVRIPLTDSPENAPSTAGFSKWSGALRIRCLQFDGRLRGNTDPNPSVAARRGMASKLGYLGRELPRIRTAGKPGEMRFEIFLQGIGVERGIETSYVMGELAMAIKLFFDGAATTPVTKLHIEDFSWDFMLLDGLGKLGRLEHLVLNGNGIDDETALSIVKVTMRIPSLVVIDLRCNALTPEGIAQLKKEVNGSLANQRSKVSLLTD